MTKLKELNGITIFVGEDGRFSATLGTGHRARTITRKDLRAVEAEIWKLSRTGVRVWQLDSFNPPRALIEKKIVSRDGEQWTFEDGSRSGKYAVGFVLVEDAKVPEMQEMIEEKLALDEKMDDLRGRWRDLMKTSRTVWKDTFAEMQKEAESGALQDKP